MWGWITPLIAGLAEFLKAIFGVTGPAEHGIKEGKGVGDGKSDDDRLRELGIKSEGDK